MKQKGKPQTLLARRIIKEHSRDGFVGAIIYAPRGWGKSSFAIKTLVDLYHNGYGIDRDKSYELALNQILYDLPGITKRIKENLDADHPTEGLIFDDAGVYFSGQTYASYVRWHALLKGFLDTVRLSTSSILMTTPNVKDLASYIRRNDDQYVKIGKGRGEWERTASIYTQYTLPSGTTRIKKIGETDYSCYLPNAVYQKYSIKRKKMLADIIAEMTERIEQGDAETLVYKGLHGHTRPTKETKKDQIITEFYNGTKLTLKGLANKYNTSYQVIKNIHAEFLQKDKTL